MAPACWSGSHQVNFQLSESIFFPEGFCDESESLSSQKLRAPPGLGMRQHAPGLARCLRLLLASLAMTFAGSASVILLRPSAGFCSITEAEAPFESSVREHGTAEEEADRQCDGLHEDAPQKQLHEILARLACWFHGGTFAAGPGHASPEGLQRLVVRALETCALVFSSVAARPRKCEFSTLRHERTDQFKSMDAYFRHTWQSQDRRAPCYRTFESHASPARSSFASS